MTKFNFLSITIIFLTFVITIGNFLIFSAKSVNVDAINESNSLSNNSLSSSSSVSSISSPKSSSSAKSKTSLSSISKASSSSFSSIVSSFKSSSSISSTNSNNSPSFKSSSSTNSSVSSVISSSKTLNSSAISVLPIKITEVGFWAPDNNNSDLCGSSIEYCGKFKWIEIYNPNLEIVNMSNYFLKLPGLNNDKNYNIPTLVIQPQSYGLIKNKSTNEPNTFLKGNVAEQGNIKALDHGKVIQVIITDKQEIIVDKVIISNLSSNAGKIKTSFFRCVDPNQNQNYTLTEKKSTNQIPYTNTLGYEFYGTPNRDDDSCTAQSSSSVTPLITGTGTTVTLTPPSKVVDMVADNFKATVPENKTINNAVVVANLIPEAIKSIEVISQTKPNINKLVAYYKQTNPVETNQNIKANNTARAITTQDIQLAKNVKTTTPSESKIQKIQQSIKPITKKVALPVVNQEIETKEIMEIDYQPSQLQWNFLSLIAIAFVMSKIYREFRDKISAEVFGVSRI